MKYYKTINLTTKKMTQLINSEEYDFINRIFKTTTTALHFFNIITIILITNYYDKHLLLSIIAQIFIITINILLISLLNKFKKVLINRMEEETI